MKLAISLAIVSFTFIITSARDDSKVKDRPELLYKSSEAFKYAEKWCKDGNDCDSGQFKDAHNFDCTHFICHVLKAGGVTVSGSSDAQCKNGLCIRVKDLGKWFNESSARYRNVKKLSGWKEAKRGDYCFQLSTFLGVNLATKQHVMLLNGTPTDKGARIYGHETNRCGEFVNFDTDACVYYRIDDSPSSR